MWTDIFEQAGQLRTLEEPFVLATVVAYKSPQSAKPGSKAIIKSDGSITGWVGGGCVQPIVLREAQKVLETGTPKLLTISPDAAHDDWKGVESFRMACEGGGSLEIYLEPVIPKPELVVVGRSPVAQMVADLAHLCEFKVCLADPEVTQAEFPNVDLVLTDLNQVRGRINEGSYVVVATMGDGDEEGLMAVVGTAPRYLGMVASEKKARSLFEYLREKGATDEQLGRIKCPAGLELGGETMPEIALSVMAEVTQLRRGKEWKPEAAEAAETAETTSERLPVVSPELLSDNSGSHEAWDPICGMTVDTQKTRYTSFFEDQTFYFCSLRCKETFDN